MKEENITIARIFCYCRQLLSLSQRKMAALLLVVQTTVNRIEKGILYPCENKLADAECVLTILTNTGTSQEMIDRLQFSVIPFNDKLQPTLYSQTSLKGGLARVSHQELFS